MADSNTDYVIGLVVDSVINLMKSQLEGKVPDAAFDVARSGAIRAANLAIPLPLQLAINAVPASAYKAAGDAAVSGAKAVANSEAVANVAGAASEGAKAVGGAVSGLFKKKE